MQILNRKELGQLYQEFNQTGVGAEIGVEYGINAKNIIESGWKGKVILVDMWEDESIYKFAMNLLPNPNYIFKRGLSHSIAKEIEDESLDWVYIDSDHTYEGTKEALEDWSKKVRKGGIIAGHDYVETPLHPSFGVIKAVNEFCANGGYKLEIIEGIDPTDKCNYASFYFVK